MIDSRVAALRPAGRRSPRRVVSFGGGTGLPAVLRGLRTLLGRGELEEVVAVVTMTDDGGSSGRLRRTRGLPPPGDLRNCLVALAAEENVMAELFQHRYGGSEELGGHTVGNLILAALTEQTGCFLEAVELSSRVLRVMGRILPATLDTVSLEAELDDGSTLVGETRIAEEYGRVRRLSLRPSPVHPTPGVLEAIRHADIVVLGPGSLHTSVVPSLLVDGIGRELRQTEAVVVLVANLVSECGEPAGLDLGDHLRVIEEHAGGAFVDALIVNDGPVDSELLARYEAQGASPLYWTREPRPGLKIVKTNLLARGQKLRHDPAATSAALMTAWCEFASAPPLKEAK
jgi:uncharacterized cofD-like protein